MNSTLCVSALMSGAASQAHRFNQLEPRLPDQSPPPICLSSAVRSTENAELRGSTGFVSPLEHGELQIGKAVSAGA
jgi:hypothetical protein